MYVWVMSHVCMSHGTYIWNIHVTCMYESCHIYEKVMSHVWMSHVPHTNESCHMYEWVMSYVWMSHVTRMNESCHICERVMSHIRTSHVTCMNESCGKFPAQKYWLEKKVPHETGLLSEKVHGCRILPELANIRCASQERANPRCDFSQIAAGKTIFCTFGLRTRQLDRCQNR